MSTNTDTISGTDKASASSQLSQLPRRRLMNARNSPLCNEPSTTTPEEAVESALNIVISPLSTSKKSLTRKRESRLNAKQVDELMLDNSDRLSQLLQEGVKDTGDDCSDFHSDIEN